MPQKMKAVINSATGQLEVMPLTDEDLAAIPVKTLTQEKQEKRIELRKAYSAYISDFTVDYMGSTFQADKESQNSVMLNIIGFILSQTTPPGFYWVDDSNNKVLMTFTQLQGLAELMMTVSHEAHMKLQTLKEAVTAASTKQEVNLIKW